jgi:hypothetical protein
LQSSAALEATFVAASVAMRSATSYLSRLFSSLRIWLEAFAAFTAAFLAAIVAAFLYRLEL